MLLQRTPVAKSILDINKARSILHRHIITGRYTTAAMASGPITRMTFFKVSKKEDQEAMIKNYEYLKANNKKARSPHPASTPHSHSYSPSIPMPQTQLSISHRTVQPDIQQNGKPYILSLEAGPLFTDPRSTPTGHSSGYTFVSKTTFASKEDFDFYDTECEAHKWLKAQAKTLTSIEGPPLMTYFTPAVVGGVEAKL